MKKKIDYLKSKDVEIERPIVSHPYARKFHTSIYRMHKYWGRKPPNVIAEYIEKNCPKNGITLDPFIGSGTTAFEAIKLKRKVIGIDINPLAIFITKTTLTPVRLSQLKEAFNYIINEVTSQIVPWYETTCNHCGKTGYSLYIVYRSEDSTDFHNETPIQISYRCGCSSRMLYKTPDKKDCELIISSTKIQIDDWYPQDLSLPQIRPGAGEAKVIQDLYTIKNLYSLSKIYAAIMKYNSGPIRDCLLLSFSSIIPQCSRLSGVDKRGDGRISAMSWILPSFRIMKEHIEKNPLEAFNLSFDRLLKGKVEANRDLSGYVEAKTSDDIFNGNATALILEASVTELKDIMKGNLVDYVFTDPPHGPSIQYMKLSSLSNAWLKMKTRSEEELIQKNNSKGAIQEYRDKLKSAFKNIRKVLSKEAKIHVYYRGEDWLGASSIIVGGGFKLIRSIFQPQRYSFRTTYRGSSDKTMQTSPPGDWILHFVDEKDSFSINDFKKENIEKIIIQEAEDVLKLRGQPTRLKYILIHIIKKLPSLIIKDNPELILKCLQKYIGDKFEITSNGKSKGSPNEMWSLLDKDKGDITLDSLVEKAAINALIGREEIGSSKPYIYQAIYSKFPGSRTPDQSTIESVLKKVAEEHHELKDGKLYLKDEYIDKKERHSELILALLRIGIKEGFRVYVSPKAIDRFKISQLISDWEEILENNRDKVISTNQIEFNNQSAIFANVLWLIGTKVHAHFEVEGRVEISNETFNRGELIRKQWPESVRILVVPHKTINSVNHLLNIKNCFWYVASYHSILVEDNPKTYQPFYPDEELSPANARPLRLKVIAKEDIPDSKGKIETFKLILQCPSDILKRVAPGHFLLVEINSNIRRSISKYRKGNDYQRLKNSPNRYPGNLEYSRIPLSIHRVYYDSLEPRLLKNRSNNFLPSKFWKWIEPGEKKYLDLLVRIVGNGTRSLHSVKVGDTINAIGPLGKTIDFDIDIENAILISGGVGIASLYPIAHFLRERGVNVILFAGAYDKRVLENKEGVILPDFVEMGVKCHVTDEIYEGKLVTDIVIKWLNSYRHTKISGKARIYSCGPWPMLKAVHEIAYQWDLPCTVLVDKLILCGVGACMTCVVPTYKNEGSITSLDDKSGKMACSCIEGPTFESRDIIWD